MLRNTVQKYRKLQAVELASQVKAEGQAFVRAAAPWQQACVATRSVQGNLRMRCGKDGGGRVSPDAEKATQPALEAGARYSSDLISRRCKGIEIYGKQAK